MSAVYDSTSRYSLDTSGQSASRGGIVRRAYTLYTVRDGDTLETIATKMLGSPTKYWQIADMNPQVKFPLDISAGTTLRLPR